MSEIVSDLYRYQEETQRTEGILFLDEINCVSETLTPVILQLLQNKTFGNHALPTGWLIVTAGNPPEYNKSVRELDMVTLDRVKHMEISADLSVWQKYAFTHQIHPAIRTYLMVYPQHFYVIEQAGQSQLFVTARGWEDLSCILTVYEKDKEKIDEELILQYLQHDTIPRQYYKYYKLFSLPPQQGTKSFTFPIKQTPEEMSRLSPGESLAIATLYFHSLKELASSWREKERILQHYRELLSHFPQSNTPESFQELSLLLQKRKESIAIRRHHGVLSLEEDLLETGSIEQAERDLYEWRKDASSQSFPLYVEQRQISKEKSLADDETQFCQLVEQAYQSLQYTPYHQNSLLYLTTDLTNDDNCCHLLAKNPPLLYQAECRRLLGTIQED